MNSFKKNLKIWSALLALASLLSAQRAYAVNSLGFDYPVGCPDAVGYYDAQDFGSWNDEFHGFHLGEDWNGKSCGDCDLNEPVYSIGNGAVKEQSYQRGWGNVVIIEHQFEGARYKTLYGHLQNVSVKNGDRVVNGQKIGTIGKGDRDKFWAHLHFELRDDVSIGAGTGYAFKIPGGYLDPSAFINSHRPSKLPDPPKLTLTNENKKVTLSWDKIETDQLDKIELYRSTTQGGTDDPTKRTTIFIATNQDVLTKSEESLSPGIYYYKLVFFYKNGLSGASEEKSTSISREFMNITDNPASQERPKFQGNKLFWLDARLESSGTVPKKIFYYDLDEKTNKTISYVGISAKRAYDFALSGKNLVFQATDTNNDYDIYAVNLENGNPYVVEDVVKTQSSPGVNDEGLAIWADSETGDIYALDLDDSAGKYVIAGGAGNQSFPKINGNTLVYKDNSRNAGEYDILMKDISGGTLTRVENNVGQGDYGFWGDYVSWDVGGKIYLKNFKTDEKTAIYSSASGDYTTTLNEGKLAYAVWESGKAYVHVFDIATKTDIKMDFLSDYYPTFDVSANWVAISRSSDGKPTNLDKEIYLAAL